MNSTTESSTNMDPPAEDSPGHILSVLNDDCIGEIFRRVKVLDDFLNMAQVCQRFEECAKTSFCHNFAAKTTGGCTRFTLIEINSRDESTQNKVHTNRAINFLEMFGPKIKSLSFQTTKDPDLDRKIFKTIAKHCGKTLIDLFIYDYDANFEQTKFELCEHLYLGNSTPINFDFHSQLKSFTIDRLKDIENGVWFMRKMPRLENFCITNNENLTDEMVRDFLSLNPDLKTISFAMSEKLSSLIFSDIAKYSPNVVDLNIQKISFYNEPDIFLENMKHLGSLMNLKKLQIDCREYVQIEALFNVFAENGVPLEELHITLNPRRPDFEPKNNLRTLKSLKIFYFHVCYGTIQLNALLTY